MSVCVRVCVLSGEVSVGSKTSDWLQRKQKPDLASPARLCLITQRCSIFVRVCVQHRSDAADFISSVKMHSTFHFSLFTPFPFCFSLSFLDSCLSFFWRTTSFSGLEQYLSSLTFRLRCRQCNSLLKVTVNDCDLLTATRQRPPHTQTLPAETREKLKVMEGQVKHYLSCCVHKEHETVFKVLMHPTDVSTLFIGSNYKASLTER